MIQFEINNKSYHVIQDESIDSIYLFGSYARGDYDRTSDIDILVIIEDCDEHQLIEQKKAIVKELNLPPYWISVYRKSSIIDMSNYGSYFLWHLKYEGIHLYSKSIFFETILAELPPFQRLEENLKDYFLVCRDIRASLDIDQSTINYDLSTLASIIRNTCIGFCSLKNHFIFGKYLPVEVTISHLGSSTLEFSLKDYKHLYQYRTFFTRNQSIPEENTSLSKLELALLWIKYAEKLIMITQKLLQERNQ
ncbi:nucleotidyltransferase domain-containing protein [Cohnella endophytica]|uniref:Nucleotidyltransferase domain-containing protein n=1 Tax=Cohnella endophytica TaxID=2419778 RepID=A0A494XI68_9BACL|nr:nucleotidyltransferase domain-containing protein [Cohnella endophytica]RKP47869.1 nucleotidyltransferase domain-containing protein [Cohnella endophytica]